MKNFKTNIFISLLIFGVAYGHQHFSRAQKQSPEIVEDDYFVPIKIKRKPASFTPLRAAPAASNIYRAEVTASKTDEGRFNNSGLSVESADVNEAPALTQGNYFPDLSLGTPSRRPHSQETSNQSRSNKSGPTTVNTSKTGSKAGTVFTNVGYPSKNSNTNINDSSSSNDTSSTVEESLSCATDVGDGAFQNAIKVSIQCSAQAEIKYCIQEGSCCDPQTQGITYTGAITVGQTNGNYCLSFYGDSQTINKTSSTVNHSYNISQQIPDLKTSFPKTHFQTTQLTDYYFLTSQDFGKANYEVGGLNLKTHDPGPQGLDMDCNEIVETYVTLVTPQASQMFNPIDMFGLILGNQLNIPMMTSNLDYGDNYVTNYIANRSHVAPVYSCSTNKITLHDFDFFSLEISHGEAGSNTVQEFSGGLVPYGFFEDDPVTNRGPAGLATEDDNGQQLQVGSFAIYYQ